MNLSTIRIYESERTGRILRGNVPLPDRIPCWKEPLVGTSPSQERYESKLPKTTKNRRNSCKINENVPTKSIKINENHEKINQNQSKIGKKIDEITKIQK